MKKSFTKTLLALSIGLSLYPTLAIATTVDTPLFINNDYQQNSDIDISVANNGQVGKDSIHISGSGKFTSNSNYSLLLTSTITDVPATPFAIGGTMLYAVGPNAEFLINGIRGNDGKSNVNLNLTSQSNGRILALDDGAKGTLNTVDITQVGNSQTGFEITEASQLNIANSNISLDNVNNGFMVAADINDTQLMIQNSTITANRVGMSLISAIQGNIGEHNNIILDNSSLTANAGQAIIHGMRGSTFTINKTNIENTATTGNAIYLSHSNMTLDDSNVKAQGNALHLLSGSVNLNNSTFTSILGNGLYAKNNNSQINANNININSGTSAAINSENMANVIINQANINTQDSAFLATTSGMINATLNNNVVNNGANLIDAVDGTVNLSASNMQLAGNILGTGANLNLNNTHWTGNAINGGNIDLSNNATWIMPDNSDVTNLTNNGSLIFASPTIGTVLTVQGNYTGNGGNIIFNGSLGDDTSPVDKLVIDGNSNGTTGVSVNNIGGLGAQTVNGLTLITVNGQSSGEFSQNGRIVAGAYNYHLVRDPNNNNNWVLMSEEGTRSEVGSYLGNLYAANNLFNLRLHDHLGETRYTDIVTGATKVTSMWLRHQYGFNQFNVAGDDLTVKNNWNITQLGGDIGQWSSNGNNRFHLGLMAGYGRSKNRSTDNTAASTAYSTVDGYSYGVYGTWFDDQETNQGLYVDSWIMWNHFNGTVNSDTTSGKYRLQGVTASLESGYSIPVGKLGDYTVLLEPQGQLIWQGIKAKDVVENNGTRASSNHGNVLSRLGLRSELQSVPNAAIGTQLFLEANWLHNTKLYNVTLNNETTVTQNGARNIAEIKTGVVGNINQNTNVGFNLTLQRGNNHYKNAAVELGLKYSF